jgi:hypothetical protein
MREFNMRLAVVFILGSLLLASGASATVIGTANFANCGGGGVAVNATQVIWTPTGSQAGYGCMLSGAGTKLDYSGGTVGAGVSADIKNLTAGGGVVDNFINIVGSSPLIDFRLTALVAANATNGTNCAGLLDGQSCVVVAGSPFLLTANAGGTGITLAMAGDVSDGVGAASAWKGLFTTQSAFTALDIQNTILGGGSIQSTYSSVVIVPEPSTISMLLLGAGLLGFGSRLRRR